MLNIMEKIELKPDLGQVLTPEDVANKMVKWAADFLPKNKYIKILDPAVGPATFLKSVQNSNLRVKGFDCYDVDEDMCRITSKYSTICSFKTDIKNLLFKKSTSSCFKLFLNKEAICLFLSSVKEREAAKQQSSNKSIYSGFCILSFMISSSNSINFSPSISKNFAILSIL